MAINYPTSLDTFTDPNPSDGLDSPSHSGLHTDLNSAVEALEAKVGVDSSAVTSSLEYRVAQLEAAGSPIVKVEAFTSSGSWTVPAGVTYAVAHIRGGGGACNDGTTTGAAGGSSSVAFSGGTVTANGGAGACTEFAGSRYDAVNGTVNSGQGGKTASFFANPSYTTGASAQDGALIVAGDTVTPAASITVTVGAGATATSGADGGSGYVWIEYQES